MQAYTDLTKLLREVRPERTLQEVVANYDTECDAKPLSSRRRQDATAILEFLKSCAQC